MCHCDLKIPLREWTFYADQIKARTMIIGPNLDLNTTKTIRQQEKRNVARIHMKALELERIRQGTQDESSKINSEFYQNEDSMDFSDQSSQDEFTCINPILKNATSTQNRKDYPNTIAAACRFGISRRALCAVANALLSDMDILTPQNALDPKYRECSTNMPQKESVRTPMKSNLLVLCLMGVLTLHFSSRSLLKEI